MSLNTNYMSLLAIQKLNLDCNITCFNECKKLFWLYRLRAWCHVPSRITSVYLTSLAAWQCCFDIKLPRSSASGPGHNSSVFFWHTIESNVGNLTSKVQPNLTYNQHSFTTTKITFKRADSTSLLFHIIATVTNVWRHKSSTLLQKKWLFTVSINFWKMATTFVKLCVRSVCVSRHVYTPLNRKLFPYERMTASILKC